MRIAQIALSSLALTVALCTAAFAKPAPPGPVATLQSFQSALTADPPQVQIFWTSLPKSYQAQIKELISQFADQTDAELWDAGFRILGKATKVAGDKAEFLRGSPYFAQFTSKDAGPAAFFTEPKHWESLVSFTQAIATSDISTHAGLKNLDPEKFLATTGAKVAKSCIDLALASAGQKDAQAEFERFRSGKFTLVEEDDDSATVKFEVAGQPAAEIELTKVDGKWIFAELAEDFEKQISAARASLKQVAITAEQKAQVLAIAKAIESGLDELLATSSQAEFDKVCAKQAEQLQGLAGNAVATFSDIKGSVPATKKPADEDHEDSSDE